MSPSVTSSAPMNPTALQPIKPLKILTIDGGGLQAVSTLLILNELLEKIAAQNGHPNRKPRPCDVFDTIAGIGAGGWLALLLGRFRMDITSCLNEWFKITQRIIPRSQKRKLRMRVFHHCYFDPERLIEQIDRLTKLYDVEKNHENLYENRTEGARTRHVFVAALKSDASGYNLFRTYEVPTSSKLPGRILKGPENPSSFKVSSAFGVTGAARYFAPKWKEFVANSGEISFRDTKFPKPHNITELALDEMWGIYGTDVPISVIVNIGPGRPQDIDVKQITRRFSWGKSVSRPSSTSSISQTTPGAENLNGALSPKRQTVSPALGFKRHSVHFDPEPGRPSESEQHYHLPVSPSRTNTVGSLKDRGFDAKLKRLENEVERDIKKKLDELYPGHPRYYFRLALDKAPKGTTLNDSVSSGVVFDATSSFLQDNSSQSTLETIAGRYSTPSTVSGHA